MSKYNEKMLYTAYYYNEINNVLGQYKLTTVNI